MLTSSGLAGCCPTPFLKGEVVIAVTALFSVCCLGRGGPPISLEDEVAVVAAEDEQDEAGVEEFRVAVAWLSPSSRVLTDPETSGDEGTPPANAS